MGILDKAGNITLPTRVPWYDYTLHPAKRFVYWAGRHLKKLPEDWRPYYRQLLANEIKATRFINTPWDVFMAVAEGYRKSKWVLGKYGQKPEPGSIPHPYDDFWESTTHEERVWAFKRSYQLKELQAIQRDDQDVFGGIVSDRNHAIMPTVERMANPKAQNGNQVHSMDLPAPREGDVREDEHLTQLLMGTIEDDRLWNPSLKAREFRESLEKAEGLYAFEPEEEDDEDTADQADPKGTPPR